MIRRPHLLFALIALASPVAMSAQAPQGRQAPASPVAGPASATQAPAAPATPAPARGGRGAPAAGGAATPAGGRGGGAPLEISTDLTGWTSMFDGVSLKGWDGPMPLWHVENGAIVVRRTLEPPVGSVYLIWQGGQPKDFEMKFDVKLEGDGANSGVQFRAALLGEVPDRPPVAGYPMTKWETHGYQADMTNIGRRQQHHRMLPRPAPRSAAAPRCQCVARAGDPQRHDRGRPQESARERSRIPPRCAATGNRTTGTPSACHRARQNVPVHLQRPPDVGDDGRQSDVLPGPWVHRDPARRRRPQCGVFQEHVDQAAS